MKTFLLIASLVICTIVVGSCKKEEAQPQIDLIKDGSAEKNPLVDWSLGYYYNLSSNPNNYKSARSGEAAASGLNSLKISCDVIKNDTTSCYFYQMIDLTTTPIPIGASLTLKAKAKMVNLRGEGLSLMIYGYKRTNGKLVEALAPSVLIPANGNSDFKEYSVRLDSYPGSVDQLYAFLFYKANTTGTVYFDDISLVVDKP